MRPPQCGHREANIQSAICFTVFLSAECTEMISEYQQTTDLTAGVFLRPRRPCRIAAISASHHGNSINRWRIFDIRHCIIRRSVTAQSCVQLVRVNQSHCLHLRTSLHRSWGSSLYVPTVKIRSHHTRSHLAPPTRKRYTAHPSTAHVPPARRRRLGCE